MLETISDIVIPVPLTGWLVYFLLTFNAMWRKHSKQNWIFVVNLLLGWTLIGWFGTIGWCYTEKNKRGESSEQTAKGKGV